jgi:hypothetical protein
MSIEDVKRTQPSEIVIARAVRDVVCDLPGIVGLSAGHLAAAATYGPGETVGGTVVSRMRGALVIDIHLIAQYSETLVLPELVERVRMATREVVQALTAESLERIDVAIDDLRLPGGRVG